MDSPDERFLAIVGVIDEADILPRLIRQLRAIGVGRIIVFDRGSTDDSPSVAEAAEAEGDVFLWRTEPDESSDVIRAAKVALARASGAEWVMSIDSDELPLPRSGSLNDLADLEDADVLAMMRYNVVLGPDGPALPDDLGPTSYGDVLLYAQPLSDPYHALIETPETPWIQGILEPKMLVRVAALESLAPGEHDATANAGRAWRRALARDIVLAHLPFRTRALFHARTANIVKRIAARPEWFQHGQGWQWVRFAEMARTGRIDEEYDRQVADAEQLEALRRSHVVRSLAEHYRQLVPVVASEEEYVAMARRAEPWVTATGLICRREGIDTGGIVKHVSRLWYPTVLVPPAHLVKLYGSWKEGDSTYEREVLALRLLEADPELPVPRLLGEGEFEGYRYLVMSRVEGHAVDSVEEHVSTTSRRQLAGWLGAFVRRLQRVPVPSEHHEATWGRFHFITTWRHEHAARIARDLGLPRHLAEAVPAWLPSPNELLVRPEASVLCHGDLTDANVLGWPHPPDFQGSGVIDFNQSFLGHPLADLGPIWWSVLRRDRVALRAFLEAAQLPGSDAGDFPRQALTWALLNPVWVRQDLADIEDVDDLDALAERWFGGWQAVGSD